MNSRLFILGIAVLTILSSCNKGLLKGLGTSEDTLVETFDFDYLQTKSKIKYESSDRSIGSNATIRMKYDSVIWISVSPIFGIEAGRGLITQDTVVFVDRMNKSVYRYNYETLSEFLNFSVTYDMIQAMILGNQIIPSESSDNTFKERNRTVISQERDKLAINNYIGKNTKRIERVNLQEVPDGSTMMLDYSNFEVINEKAFPFSSLISILYKTRSGSAKTTVSIDHSKVETSSDKINFPFSVPSKYEN